MSDDLNYSKIISLFIYLLADCCWIFSLHLLHTTNFCHRQKFCCFNFFSNDLTNDLVNAPSHCRLVQSHYSFQSHPITVPIKSKSITVSKYANRMDARSLCGGIWDVNWNLGNWALILIPNRVFSNLIRNPAWVFYKFHSLPFGNKNCTNNKQTNQWALDYSDAHWNHWKANDHKDKANHHIASNVFELVSLIWIRHFIYGSLIF